MATAAANLSVPAPADDTMEMSSPGRPNLDEDIDFDDWQPEGASTNVNEDDRMMDDGEQTRPATATDDVMEDDVQQGEQTVVHEEVMQDSPSHEQQLEDEELIDYSDDELPDELVDDAGAPEIAEQAVVNAPVADIEDGTVQEEVVHPSGEAPLEQLPEDAAEVTTVTEEDVATLPTEEAIAVPDDFAAADGYDVEDVDGLDHSPTNQPPATDVEERTEEQGEAGLDEDVATDGSEAQPPVISLDTSAQTSAEGPGTPTDTGLHAMTVRFGDFQFPLFKSRHQPEGLLKNDNLASLSLGELIQNCRQRLAIKTGENVSEDQDLVLGFDQLGLILVEDSRAAFACSLDEVLDIYLQLHRNDAAEDIPPFSLNLSLQLKFTSSISVLKQAAAGGSGMSSFGFHHAGDEQQVGEYDEYDGEHGEEGQEEYDDQYHQDVTAEGQQYEQTAQIQGSIPEQQEADTNNYHGEHQGQDFENPQQEDYHQENEQYQEELGQGEYYEEYQDEATQLLDDHVLEGESQLDESADTTYHAPDGPTTGEDESVHTFFEAAAEEEKTASAATSTTLQGDDGQDATGEYTEEDLIDWEDDSHLTSAPSEQTSQGHMENSTLQTGKDAEGAQNGQHQGDLEQDLADAGEADGQDHAEAANVEATVQDLRSEDYVGDQEEQQYGEGHQDQDDDHGAAYTEQDGLYGEEFDPADEPAAQQGHFEHPDNELGEEDDPFQTAYELFDVADQEQGHEQHAPDNPADETPLVGSAPNGEPHGDPDDFIDFDLDEEVTVGDSTVKDPDTAAAGSRTPLAKRSYEDLAGDEIDFDSPEPKKARAS